MPPKMPIEMAAPPLRACVLAVAACFAGNGLALPNAPTVASGQAGFAYQGKSLTVTNTPGAIINWQQFSIQKDEITRFIQQNASSARTCATKNAPSS